MTPGPLAHSQLRTGAGPGAQRQEHAGEEQAPDTEAASESESLESSLPPAGLLWGPGGHHAVRPTCTVTATRVMSDRSLGLRHPSDLPEQMGVQLSEGLGQSSGGAGKSEHQGAFQLPWPCLTGPHQPSKGRHCPMTPPHFSDAFYVHSHPHQLSPLAEVAHEARVSLPRAPDTKACSPESKPLRTDSRDPAVTRGHLGSPSKARGGGRAPRRWT